MCTGRLLPEISFPPDGDSPFGRCGLRGRSCGREVIGEVFFGSILADSGDAFCCGRRPSERLVFRFLEEANRTVGVGGMGSRGDGLAVCGVVMGY